MSLEKEIRTILEEIKSIGGTGKFPTGISIRAKGYRSKGDQGQLMLDPATGFAAGRRAQIDQPRDDRPGGLTPDDLEAMGVFIGDLDLTPGPEFTGPKIRTLDVEEPQSAKDAEAEPKGYDTVNILGTKVRIPRYVDVKDRKDPDALARGQSLPLPDYVPPEPEEQPSADTTQQTSGYSADNLPKTDIGEIKTTNGDIYRWSVMQGKYEKVYSSKWDHEVIGESIKYDLIRKTLMESNGTTPSTSSFMDKVKGGGKGIGKDILIYSVINWAFQKLFGDDAPEIEAPGRATVPTDLSQGALAKAKKLKGVPGVELPGGSRGNVVHGVKNIFRKRRAKEKRK